MNNRITLVKVINNDKILEESIGNIIKSGSFKKNLIELKLVNILNNDKVNKYIKDNNLEKYLVNDINSTNEYEIYNILKRNIDTKYVNFSTTSTFVEAKELDKIINLLDSNKCVLLSLTYYPLDELKYAINYLKLPRLEYGDENTINIEKDIDVFSPLIDSYFYKYDEVKNIDLDYNNEYCNIKYIMDIISIIKEMKFLRDSIYYINVLENDFNNSTLQYNKEWYLNYINNFAIPYLKNNNNLWIQHTFIYYVGLRYASNMNARNKNILTEEELTQFENQVIDLLEYIDYSVLKDFNNYYVSRTVIEMFIQLKSKGNLSLSIEDGEVLLKNNDSVALKSEQMTLDVIVMEYDQNKLCIDAEILSSIFMTDGALVKVYLNGNELKYVKNDVYTYTKLFNKIRHKKYSFRLEIPLELLNNKKNVLYFEYDYKDYKSKLPIAFKKPSSKLNTQWNNTYFRFAKKMVTYDMNNCNLIIKNKHTIISFKKEFCLIFEYLFKSKNKVLGIKSVVLRLLYWITKPFYGKNIWISFDKLFKGGDNGEYYYHYVAENKKGVKMCYIINKNCVDYKRLKNSKCKHIYGFRSVGHYLNVLNCKFMFATHANPYDYNGFTSGVEKYFRDLLTFKTFCIQHGLSVNQIAKFQNRVYASTKLYFCASKYEIKNLSLPEYDYDGYNALRLTGVPRYDGLKSNDKKIILITPTWRQSSSSKLVHLNMARQYNKEFKQSEYYKVYNNLINDKKLIECAKENGYKIMYLLHPAVSSQLKDFKGNEFVDVVAATGNMSYEKVLTESSLMVTDYSGVQFDFAYMRKPIVYYHPTTLPPHYEESCFMYDTMGFGPIIENQEELVNSLCDYMNNNCKMKEEYIERANDFFEYDDFNNCKRILEETEKYIENSK